jgi:hypothetical protein
MIRTVNLHIGGEDYSEAFERIPLHEKPDIVPLRDIYPQKVAGKIGQMIVSAGAIDLEELILPHGLVELAHIPGCFIGRSEKSVFVYVVRDRIEVTRVAPVASEDVTENNLKEIVAYLLRCFPMQVQKFN